MMQFLKLYFLKGEEGITHCSSSKLRIYNGGGVGQADSVSVNLDGIEIVMKRVSTFHLIRSFFI